MTLTPGTHLGSYEIVSLIGAGGMGEVYRARDPRLNRVIAIKVLPEATATDPDRRARFEREAQSLAALNHSNIVTIYSVEEAGGVVFLTMEYVDGRPLSDLIVKGGLPLTQILNLGIHLADGVSAAHQRGITHRDLKPANVMVTAEGRVKVLDFGLAKLMEATPRGMGVTDLPTGYMTVEGLILGTVAYMSPEQAEGKPIDQRSDLFSLGVMLYEVAIGQRPFNGDTSASVLSAVIKDTPRAVTDLKPALPRELWRIIRKCLVKDPEHRYQSASDLRTDLTQLKLDVESDQLPEDAPRTVTKDGRLWKIAAGTLAVLSIGLGYGVWRATRPGTTTLQNSVRLDLDLGPGVIFASTTGPSIALSPDGTRLVFVAQGADGIRRLYTRRLDQSKVTELSDTEGAFAPFFNPDGQWVGFFAKGKLNKTRIDGGQAKTLCDAAFGRGGTWGEDGYIIASLNTLTGLARVSSDGGTPAPLTELAPGEYSHRWPQVLPGGKAVLFTVSQAGTDFDEADVVVLSLQDHRRTTVMRRAGMYPRYLQSGHLAYVSKGWLSAVSFDPDTLEVGREPIKLAEVSYNSSIGFAEFDVAQNGTLAYRTGEGLMTVDWLDGTGKTDPLIAAPGIYNFLRLSPFDNRLAYTATQGGNVDLFVYDWERSNKTRLTNAVSDSIEPVTLTGIANPVWSPDGQFVVFRGGAGGLHWARSDGAGKPQLLAEIKSGGIPLSFGNDTLAFSQFNTRGGPEIRTWRVASQSGQLRVLGNSRLFVETSTADVQAAFSPDGRWLAYADAVDGDYQVYVRPFPDRDPRVRVSSDVGMVPRWSTSGHELFYRTDDQKIMIVNYTVSGTSFIPGNPRLWSGKPLFNTGTAWNYDVARDGTRILALMPTLSPEPRETQSHVIVANLFDDVRRRISGVAK